MNKLVMRFKTSTEGKYFTLTVDDLKQDEKGVATITEKEINDLMALVVSKDVFITAHGSLTGKKDAKVVSTETKEVDVA
jgi:hypothetical protein